MKSNYIEWKDEYNTDIPLIDYQHQNLITYINKIYQINDMEPDKAQLALDVIFDNLVNYTKYHFITEEQIMLKYNDPNYDFHYNQHLLIKQNLLTLINQFNHNLLQMKDLLHFVNNWVINHISTVDITLKQHLKNLDIDLNSL